jgi:hypothetical protein
MMKNLAKYVQCNVSSPAHDLVIAHLLTHKLRTRVAAAG